VQHIIGFYSTMVTNPIKHKPVNVTRICIMLVAKRLGLCLWGQ